MADIKAAGIQFTDPDRMKVKVNHTGIWNQNLATVEMIIVSKMSPRIFMKGKWMGTEWSNSFLMFRHLFCHSLDCGHVNDLLKLHATVVRRNLWFYEANFLGIQLYFIYHIANTIAIPYLKKTITHILCLHIQYTLFYSPYCIHWLTLHLLGHQMNEFRANFSHIINERHLQMFIMVIK